MTEKSLFNWRSPLYIVYCMLCMTLALSITSCKDDDDKDDNSNEQRDTDPTETAEANAAFRWLCALTDTREMTADWASKTYEPTIGQPSTQNSLHRLVLVSTLEEAQEHFASLANIGIEELDRPKTVTDQGVGTLTWTPAATGADNMATVDVNSPLLPRLTRIVYCTAEQVGENGAFDKVKGTAYYRFGDVVVDADGYYWVCVRPSFEPDKGDSHWINIFNAAKSGGSRPIPEKYLQRKWDRSPKYGGVPIVLPTKLPFESRHLFNLSQLLQAMLRPQAYEKFYKHNNADLTRHNGLGGFQPIYNGRKFVEKVAAYWNEPVLDGYNVWQILFNTTQEKMKQMQHMDFLFQGYKWGFFDGNNATVYSYRSSMYESAYRTPVSPLVFDVTRGFDVRWFTADPNSSQANHDNFMNQLYSVGNSTFGRWVTRYATGKELGGGKYSPYEPLGNSCIDIYRYNDKTDRNPGSELEKEDNI